VAGGLKTQPSLRLHPSPLNLSAMIDTHCHLDSCDVPVADLVARAREANVTRMLAIGMDGDSCRHAIAAAEEHPEVFVSVGRHPHRTQGIDSGAIDEIEALAGHPKVRAIGETGLDYKREYSPPEDQQLAFELQIEVALRLHLPLVIHTREAEQDTFTMLDRYTRNIPIIMHCFSLTRWVYECIDRGFYCSFAGNVTYPQAEELREAAKVIPDELLLVETDAPFLSPQEFRGKPNEPAFVRSTASFLAELRGQTYEQLEQVVESNAAWIFRW
jgi:TatD DNase family protein